MGRRRSFMVAEAAAVAVVAEEAAEASVEVEGGREAVECLDRRRQWVGRHPLAQGRDLAEAYRVQAAELVRAVLGRAELVVAESVLEGRDPEVEFPVAVARVLAAASAMSADRLRRD